MPGYSKEYAMNEKAVNRWSEWSGVMKRGSDDLIAAVKARDVKSLAQAVGKLSQACIDCHANFR